MLATKRILVWLAFAVAFPAVGSAGGHGCCCMCGKKVCHVTVERTTEEEECFEVECEDVCIPPVCFPWECPSKRTCCHHHGPAACGCDPCQPVPNKCGKVRTIRKLALHTREVPVCEYNWEVVIICSACRHSHHHRHHHLGSHHAELDTDLIPFQDYEGVPTPADAEVVHGRGAPLETPRGDLIYGPVRDESVAPVRVGAVPNSAREQSPSFLMAE